MTIYLVCFFISSFLVYLSQRSQKRLLRICILFFAVLCPCILAGWRDSSIGTDVEVYGNPWFLNALSSTSFTQYLKWGTSSSIGSVYLVINWIAASITNDVHFFYFLLALVEILLIINVAFKNKTIVSPWLVVLSYYLLFYNLSLNLLRQGLALCFCANIFHNLRSDNKFSIAFWLILACGSHDTAFVCIFFILVWYLLKTKLSRVWYPLIIGVYLILVLFFQKIVVILYRFGIISERYYDYLFGAQQGGGVLIRLVLLCVPCYLMLKVLIRKTDINYKFFVTISLISLFGSVLAYVMTYIMRIIYYSDIYFIFILPYIAKFSKYKIYTSRFNINSFIIIGIEVVYWLVVYGYQNSGETVPYLFSF